MPGGRTASSAARPSKQSSVAALKGVLADPTRAPSPASKRRPQQQPSTDATAGQPKESSVDVAKMRRAQQPTRPPPAPEYVARVSSTAAERKVGSVDSAKGRPPPPAPPPHRAVDVEELCNSLNVTLADRVPASRSRFKKKAAKPPGSIDLLWSALRPEDSGAEGDAESGVDVWETSPGEKWTRAGLCGALVSSFFVGIGQPPCAAVKLVCLWPCCLVLTWAYVVLPLPLGPFASYAALALGVLAVIAQSFTVSFPLAAGFSRISTDLANMLDAAFAEQDAKLTAWTQRKVASLSLPPSIEPKVARVLSRPPAVALGFVRKLIPDFERRMSEEEKTGKKMSPTVFKLLIVALLVVQVLPVMMFALPLDGTAVVVASVLVIVLLGILALYADRCVWVVVKIYENFLNGIIQFLFRRILNLHRMQALFDAAADPKRVFGLASKADSRASDDLHELVHAEPKLHYGLVFDAGSSGTRIHVYTWRTGGGGPKDSFDLVSDDILKIKPGLSAYKDSPADAGKSLRELLKFARDKIPAEAMTTTPTFLMATAGLRLVGPAAKDAILRSVCDELSNSGVLFRCEWATLLDGVDEGLYGWVTVNYLRETLYPPTTKEPVGIIDLGGGSVQIVFEQPEAASAPAEYVRHLDFGGRKHDVYVKSHLDFGLDSARTKLMELLLARKGGSEKPVKHPCWPKDHTDQYKEVTFVGASDWHRCLKLQGQLFDNGSCTYASCSFGGAYQPPLPDTFNAFSYMYDRTAAIGLLDFKMQQYGSQTMSYDDISKAGEGVCDLDKQGAAARFAGHQDASKSHNFCGDVAYIAALLRALGFEHDTKLTMTNKIENVELVWTLGAMLAKSGELASGGSAGGSWSLRSLSIALLTGSLLYLCWARVKKSDEYRRIGLTLSGKKSPPSSNSYA